eukprot:SAG31_NODE_1012_length_10379_cov_3.699319_7_plen_53_part_00
MNACIMARMVLSSLLPANKFHERQPIGLAPQGSNKQPCVSEAAQAAVAELFV